jgi:Cu-processing system ATP-binding protein
VTDLTFRVRPGEVVALLGPNGCGKTTSLKAAAGLITPTSGEVLLGEPGISARLPQARRILSFLPQRVAFPESLTGREVVEFYGRLRQAKPSRVERVLRIAALNGAAGAQVSTYSGGMVQRLGLAVAVLPDAQVLLLDEPTASLDPEGLQAIYALVAEARRAGKAVLFTSHQLEDVRALADRVLILVGGQLVAHLDRAELDERLAMHGRLLLRLDRCPENLLARVRQVAPDAHWDGERLHLSGVAAAQMESLLRVRAAPVKVRAITFEDGGLDALYRELVESR